jgi:excisionase family DNA binding protein
MRLYTQSVTNEPAPKAATVFVAPPLVLTVEETANLLRCSPRTVYELIATKKLAAKEVAGRLTRVSYQDAIDYINGCPDKGHVRNPVGMATLPKAEQAKRRRKRGNKSK